MRDVFDMSRKELDRAAVLDKLADGKLTSHDAAALLDVSTRHVRRLQAAYRGGGAIALRSARRGVLSIIAAHYGDFGPTPAAEKLLERHGIAVSRETVHQLRPRRERFGELIQIDGSLHAWFEDRGPMCSLLVFIDDATGRRVDLHFCPSESTFDYMIAAKRYVGRYGKPLAFYSNKHSIFRSAKESETGEANLIQFGRALSELNIDIICANSSQAKGQVERANGTLQDRLVKELRLAGISDIAAANAFAERYRHVHNEKFAVAPSSPADAHRPVAAHEDLDHAFCVKSERVVSRALSVQYDKVRFNLEPSAYARRIAGRTVTICDYPDGRLVIEHGAVALPYTRFDTLQRVGRPEIVENKRLAGAIASTRLRAAATPRNGAVRPATDSRRRSRRNRRPEKRRLRALRML
jgi:hypothetical protein